MTHKPPILITVTGPDKPGITASLTEILMSSSAELLDVEQVVVQGRLTLCLLIRLLDSNSREPPILKDLLYAAKMRGQALDFEVVDDSQFASSQLTSKYALTLMGDPVSATALHFASQSLGSHGANIDYIRRLSRKDMSSLEVGLTLLGGANKADGLKWDLLSSLSEHAVDFALQRETLTRRSKRLVVMDIDSTLISVEVIDELAKLNGTDAQVSKITERAMAGELDFDSSLKARVKYLKGIPTGALDGLAESLPLNLGAETLVNVLKQLGYKIALISGGFTFAANALKDRLGLDHAISNHLVERDGILTGEVHPPIINAEAKAKALEKIAKEEGVSLEQTIAIGDGANDSQMLSKAGLGIAFHAKRKLRENADTSLSYGGLERILYLLGIKAEEVESLLGANFAKKS